MADFNLQTLYNFRPARYMCEKCCGLLVDPPQVAHKKGPQAVCPVCGVEYEPTKEYSGYDVHSYLDNCGLGLEFVNLLQHCIDLAQATVPRPWEKNRLPMQTLLETLSKAEKFVHFVSYGMSAFFHGVLKLVAQRVTVRGILANANERDLDEFDGVLKTEAPIGQLKILRYPSGEPWEDFPHQKLIVIDGLMAFKGSANLTLNGWRKAARGRENVEVVTNSPWPSSMRPSGSCYPPPLKMTWNETCDADGPERMGPWRPVPLPFPRCDPSSARPYLPVLTNWMHCPSLLKPNVCQPPFLH